MSLEEDSLLLELESLLELELDTELLEELELELIDELLEELLLELLELSLGIEQQHSIGGIICSTCFQQSTLLLDCQQ